MSWLLTDNLSLAEQLLASQHVLTKRNLLIYFAKLEPVHRIRAEKACGVQDLKLGSDALVVWVLALELHVTNVGLF